MTQTVPEIRCEWLGGCASPALKLVGIRGFQRARPSPLCVDHACLAVAEHARMGNDVLVEPLVLFPISSDGATHLEMAFHSLADNDGLAWMERDEGGHRHVWLRVPNGVHVWHDYSDGAITLCEEELRQCTCGMYEHEHHGVPLSMRRTRDRIAAGTSGALADWARGESCSDPDCERAAGHPGPHMSRSWDAQAEIEVTDAWPTDAAQP